MEDEKDRCTTSLWKEGRDGPAKHWYNYYNWPKQENDVLPETGPPLQLDDSPSLADDGLSNQKVPQNSLCFPTKYEFPDDAFHMVTQMEWEKEVIWDSSNVKYKKQRAAIAGWIPSSSKRTVGDIFIKTESIDPPDVVFDPYFCSSEGVDEAEPAIFEERLPSVDNFDSPLYVENADLVHGQWEDKIIWEIDDAMRQEYMHTQLSCYDATDDNIVFSMPKEIGDRRIKEEDGSTSNESTPSKSKVHPHSKKSRLLLGRTGMIAETVTENNSVKKALFPKIQPAIITTFKDPFNISNDEYYLPKRKKPEITFNRTGSKVIHSIPVAEFKTPFIPTFLSVDMLRNFHRPLLQVKAKQYELNSLEKLMKKINKKRTDERKKTLERNAFATARELLAFKLPFDLSGKDGEILLIENCEEYPPLLSQVGMCSKIKNYYQSSLKRTGTGVCTHPYGSSASGHKAPFLGILKPGQNVSALINNLYCSPIYPHETPVTDFLIIVNAQRTTFCIRAYDALFTAGQQCPFFEVPVPNSNKAKSLQKNFVLAHTYRKFRKSQSQDLNQLIGEKLIVKVNDICKAFPDIASCTIRKWLTSCAEIKREDHEWVAVMKADFNLPKEEEIQKMFSPEECCAYYAFLAAEQRLKDLGYYSEKCVMFVGDENDNEGRDFQGKLEDEVKTAPWNTTTAFVQALKGKSFLQVNGPADPTGCGEGFSYVRVPKKTQVSNELVQSLSVKRAVTGTDADLRRLSVKNAKGLLRKFGIPEDEIKRLSRWEVIDLVRTVSTEKAKAGETENGMTKFSRINKTAVSFNQERYKEECQRVFDLQNSILSSKELLSTDDEDDSDVEDSQEDKVNDLEEMSRNIEKILRSNKSCSEWNHEREEQERLELQRMMLRNEMESEKAITGLSKRKAEESPKTRDAHGDVKNTANFGPGHVLKIQRTFRNENGEQYTRSEIVRDPGVIRTYIYMRKNKNEAFLRSQALKEAMEQKAKQRRKRRLHDETQLERKLYEYKMEKMVKKRRKEIAAEYFPNLKEKNKAEKALVTHKRKCGLCGQLGHVRSSKECPMYNPDVVYKSKNKRGHNSATTTVKYLNNTNEGNDLKYMKVFNLPENSGAIYNTHSAGQAANSVNDPSSSSDSNNTDDSSDDDSDDESDSDDKHVSNPSSQHDTNSTSMVSVDGTKMVLRVPQEIVQKAQQESEEAQMIALGLMRHLKRRTSQTDREQGNYFIKSYKTTSADRQARMLE